MNINRIHRTFLAAVAALALGTLPATGVLAANGAGQGQGQGAGQGQEMAEIDDQTLDQFVTAFLSVRDIQSEFSEELGNVEDRERAQELQAEAQDKMVEAVEEAGLSVQEYNQVATQMQNDSDLRERVTSAAEDAMQ
ncbi:MAG: DUF4168 domain-containing protein [Pseudomonadota bacterium]